MKRVISIPVENIDRRRDTRPIDRDVVDSLATSIEEVGLINPIRVRRMGDRFELIAGSHRYAACDSLEWREIPAVLVEDDDLHAELAMIDENLCRAELSPSDRARQTARRKAIYEELHPQTKQGGAPGLSGGGKAKVDNLSSFASTTADVTGRDQRSVRRDAERGEKVIEEVLDMLRGTKLDTGSYLDRIKKLPPNDQVTAVKRDLVISRQKDRAKPPTPAPSSHAATKPAIGEDTFLRFIALADDIEALRIADLIRASGSRRSVLGQRASGLASMMSDITEGLSQ